MLQLLPCITRILLSKKLAKREAYLSLDRLSLFSQIKSDCYSVTRDERYWEEPEQFSPYRFLDENGKLRKDLLEKFYPFGIGPRRCIGESLGRLQIFLFFTNLMHQCKFEKVSGEKLSLEPGPGIFMGPKNYRVTVKPRL